MLTSMTPIAMSAIRTEKKKERRDLGDDDFGGAGRVT